MLLTEFESTMQDLSSVFKLSCETGLARSIEYQLRQNIFRFEFLKDDHLVEPYFQHSWNVNSSNFGVEVVEQHTGNNGMKSAKTWEPPIKDISADFHKLKKRTFSVDRASEL